MRWQWLFGNFAEPGHGLSHRKGHELSDRAHREMPKSRFHAWTAVFILLPVFLLMGFALPAMLDAMGMAGQSRPHLIGIGVIVVLAWPLSAFVYGHLYTKSVRRAMRNAGREVCVECGHSLHELPAEVDRCPECGHERAPEGNGS